mmetsp:Transcript_5571/g.12646  ORF Transcript_5571/g.12646 Transcript_5571/m.12646 type:complete len:470 (-) Transcript_5571:8-1417(-)
MEEGEAGCHDSNAHAGHQMWLQHSGVQVGGGIDLARHLPDVHLEALLDLFQHSRILVVGHKGDCQTFCAESASTPDPVQVGVAVVRHVVVDDDVDPLNVNPASEQVCGDHDTFLELLELLISHNAVLLIQARVDRNGREIALHQELVQSNRPLHGLHEYDHLVEFQGIKQIVQLTVLLLLRELCVVLQQPVQGELRLLVHPDLMGVLHELFAQRPRVRAHGGAEHHHLLFLRSLNEDLLHILAHVQLVQALVTLIQDKLRQLVQLQVLLPEEAKDPARCANEHVRAATGQHLLVLGNRCASVDDARLHVLEILGESIKLVLDLVCQLTRVADDQDLHCLLRSIYLLEAREDEDSCLAHTRLGLTQHVGAQDGLRDALVLHLRRVLEAAVHYRAEKFRLQQEVTETRSMDGRVAPLLRIAIFRLLLRVFLVRGLLLVEVGEILLVGSHFGRGAAPQGILHLGTTGGVSPT